MRSLRGRLTAWLSIGSGLLLAAGGLLLYGLIGARVRADFDQVLLDKARTLAVMTEQEHGTVWLELTGGAMREFEAPAKPEYFEIWRGDGAVVARSLSLGERDLPRGRVPSAESVLADLALPDGRRGRAIELTFEPRHELAEPYGRTAPPIADRMAGATLVVARSREDLDAFLASLRAVLLAFVLSLLAGIFVLVRLSLRVGLAPLARLGEHLGSLGAESLGETLDAGQAPAELAPVIARLNGLLLRLKASFERERTFSADLAHELRTPLAELRSMVEVALKWPEDPTSSAALLEEIGLVGRQMERIVVNLLALARCDGGQQTVWRSEVPLAPLLERCWQPVAAEAAARGVALATALPAGLTLATDEDKLALVLSNLLANAVAYGVAGEPVTCSASVVGPELALRVSNRTDQLEPDDVPQVFDRFWRKDAARSGGQHAGLGLSLVSALAKLLGFTVTAHLEHGEIFHVTLAGRTA